MALAFRLHRLVVRLGVGTALCWGVLAGELFLGLWAAVWMIALMCGGIGALLHEYDNTRPGRWHPVRPEGRRVMVSGFGYLAVVIVAGAFPPGITAALLLGVIADFSAGHYVVASQHRSLEYARP